MKITKNALKQLIKEELELAQEAMQDPASLSDADLAADAPQNPGKIPDPQAPAAQRKPVASDPSKMIVGIASSLRNMMPALQQLQKSLESYIAATQKQAVNLEEQESDEE